MAGSITTPNDAVGMKGRGPDEFERSAATYDRPLLRHSLFCPAYRATMEAMWSGMLSAAPARGIHRAGSEESDASPQ